MDCPTITIKQGRLQGKLAKNRKGDTFYSFQGIPYAKPPLGNLRFKAPQPPESWIGIRDATKEGNECFQYDPVTHTLVGSEDCLNLNVYTPIFSNQEQLKPVMFYIHGGAFIEGYNKTTLYGPDYLMTEDIVLVNINYRLGLLGFLTFEDQSLGVPGNAGFKDMVMALKWVQQNISSFGGDPNNVTIFGESAGGCSTHLLYISPMSKGLFHRAIAQSGSGLNLWCLVSTNSGNVADTLGITYGSEKELLEKLRETSVEDLMTAQDALDNDVVYASVTRKIGATIEKQTNEPAFLPEHPWDLVLKGEYNKIPLMIGYTNKEGILLDLLDKLDKKKNKDRFTKDFEYFVPNVLQVPRGSILSKKIASKIKQFYAGNEEINKDNIEKDYVMRTDIFFLRGLYSTARNHAKMGCPVYFYRVSVESKLNIYKTLSGCTMPGVCHADELGYLFNSVLNPEIEPGSLEDISVTRFVKLWTSFAKNGDPNPRPQHELINVSWKPVKENEFNFLDIGSTLLAGVDPDGERMKFWDDILNLDEQIDKRF